MTESKLDDRLDDNRSIKFTDYAINKFQGDFENTDVKSITVKFENSGLKGLKLTQYRTTKRKFFHQGFWFDERSDYWSVGEFRPDVYGVNECRKDVNEMMDDHTNADGHWTKNPKITKKYKNERVKKAEILKLIKQI